MTRPLRLIALSLAVASLAAPVATAADRPFKGHASGTIQSFPDPARAPPASSSTRARRRISAASPERSTSSSTEPAASPA